MNRVKEIFAEALERHGASAAYLDQACAEDPELRAEVEAFLMAAAQAEAFRDTAAAPTLFERAGAVVGRYKLLEQIGEGGFGVVFMAEQETPVRRRVALKIIKLGMDTKQVVARFEAERQALAMMDHRGIAKVFDGGATDTGRPYFVMELVRGTPITTYCDHQKLSIAQRLDLFAQVCQAVQHAHQKGLIHRDIKPSNVLISTQDDRPVSKVIDFGIAKATQARLTEKTLFTEFRQMVGTPEYMSPEQADGGLDIDMRSDIYSLGVLLYELLAGCPPFDSTELRAKAYGEIQRIIREVDPPAPSTRLSTMKDSLPSIAAQRAVEPRKLEGMLRGELDWIVMRCLEKDRKRRYDTAAGLARDIERYLANEPVEAQHPTRAYRLRKFVQRNKVGVLAGCLIALALSAGLVVSSYFQAAASRKARNTKTALAQSESNRRNAEGVNKFLTEEVFGLADPGHYDRAGITLVQALDLARPKVDSKFPNDPALRADIRERFGEIYIDIFRPKEAVEELREAVRLRTQLTGPRDPVTMRTRSTLGYALYVAHLWRESEQVLRSTWTDQSAALGGGNRDAVRTASRLACVLMDLRGVWFSSRLDKSIDPLPVSRSAYEQAMKALGPDDEATLEIENELAWNLRWQQKPQEAYPYVRHAALGLRKLKGAGDPLAMLADYNYTVTLQETHRLDEALAEAEALLKIQLQVLGPLHDETMLTVDKRALILEQMGRKADAIASLDVILPHLDEIAAAGNPKSILRFIWLAGLYMDAGMNDRAASLFDKAVQICDRVGDDILREHLEELDDLEENFVKLGNKQAALQMRTRIARLEGNAPAARR